ncbi:hypothetical protein QQP08_022951, partial [Theobroma cacao]
WSHGVFEKDAKASKVGGWEWDGSSIIIRQLFSSLSSITTTNHAREASPLVFIHDEFGQWPRQRLRFKPLRDQTASEIFIQSPGEVLYTKNAYRVEFLLLKLFTEFTMLFSIQAYLYITQKEETSQEGRVHELKSNVEVPRYHDQ